MRHWLLWDNHGRVTVVWSADVARRALDLGRRIEGPFVLEQDERIPDGTYGGARPFRPEEGIDR